MPPVRFWGYSGLILAVGAILQWKWSSGEIDSARQALMARQRGVAAELGPRWYPLRDEIEQAIVGFGRDPGQEVIDKASLKDWDFRDKAGIYLRLRLDEAATFESIRAGAKDSLRDGFTACLMRVPNAMPLAGHECKRTRDCATGEICNELDHCSRPAQPFNLRVAYRTMFILSDEWVRDVQDASAELRLRLLTASFDDTVRDDLPVAADLLQRAQYLLAVLDEPAPDAPALPANASNISRSEALQALPHFARVAVWRIKDGKPLLKIRREANGQMLGGVPAVDSKVLDSRQRQANSCALALSVREAMGDESGASAPLP